MLLCLWYTDYTLNEFFTSKYDFLPMIIKGMVFWRHKSHLVKLSMCCHPRWPALQVIRAAIVSNINSSFLAKFRFPVTMSTREDVSNTVENNRIHKVIGP